LRIETVCNSDDGALIENLEAAKKAGHRTVPLVTDPADFPSVPLVICGSGPSLKDYLELIPRDGSVHVMALNGAYNVLRDAGIVPHYFAMLDARAVNVNFLTRPSTETTFLLASQVHPDCFAALHDYNAAMFHLNTPTTKGVFTDAPVYYGGGTTIGLTAMGLAGGMGYRKLLLLGYDSSYDGDAKHARHQPQNDTDWKLDAWVEDRQYWTSGNMAQQVMDFREWSVGLHRTFPGIEITLAGRGLLYDYVVTGQLRVPTRESEAAKYSEMYQHDGYAMGETRRTAIEAFLPEIDGASLLDVGTGRGETLDIARKCGFTTAHGTETVPALLGLDITYGLLPYLPHSNDAYEVVTCFEVLEHLLPEDVVPALRELARVARRTLIVSTATYSHRVSGVELHPSHRSEDEWLETIRTALDAPVTKIADFDKSPVWRIDLSKQGDFNGY
jgi:uncharacterized Rossmann fold enzyme